MLFSSLPAQGLAHPINGHGILLTDSSRPAGKGRSSSGRQLKAGVALTHPTPAAHQTATDGLSQESEASRNSDKDKTKHWGISRMQRLGVRELGQDKTAQLILLICLFFAWMEYSYSYDSQFRRFQQEVMGGASFIHNFVPYPRSPLQIQPTQGLFLSFPT